MDEQDDSIIDSKHKRKIQADVKQLQMLSNR